MRVPVTPARRRPTEQTHSEAWCSSCRGVDRVRACRTRPVARRLIAWLLVGLVATVATAVRADDSPHDAAADVEVFVRAGCPHCEQAEAFLARLRAEQPDLVVVVADVSVDADAAARLAALGRAAGTRVLGVPAFWVRGRLIVGFAGERTTGRGIRALLAGEGAPPDVHAASARGPSRIEVPWLGAVDVRAIGLPVFTVLLGLVDGVNPCAMWGLLLVLSLLLNLRDRGRMLLLGGTFVAVGGVVYFAFMAAWLEAFLVIGVSRPLQLALGAVAIGVGALNVKDFFALGRGPSVHVPDAARPRLYARVRRVLAAENVAGALAATVVLSATANVVELACTAGLPALYTQVLAAQGLTRAGYYGYLALYNLAYVADDLVVLAVVVTTLTHFKLAERGARWLKLLSGLVMAGLGALLVAGPGGPL